MNFLKTKVCVNYQETNISKYVNETLAGQSILYYHMNWGWYEWSSNPPYNSADYNGWFAFNCWNIPDINRNYQYAQDMVTEIYP